MTDKLPDVWYSRDLPLLIEITRRIDAGQHAPFAKEIGRSIGMDDDTTIRAMRSLDRAGLIKGVKAAGVGILRVTDVSPRAYQLSGLHPDEDDQVSSLVSALRQAAEATPDEDERGRLRRVADAVGGVSRDVMAGVLTAYINAHVPH